MPREPVIRVSNLVVGFGRQIVLDHVSLSVEPGEIFGLVGGSGSGKSVLLRSIIGLIPAREGRIEVLGMDLTHAGENARQAIQKRWGILFQQGALLSSLSVLQNVQFPMREHLRLSDRLLDEIAKAKLDMVGLGTADWHKFPSELSGGMTKRVALARALALDPELVFLDEPTSGLDPISAGEFDELIRTLQQTLELTVFMITHDLEKSLRRMRPHRRPGARQARGMRRDLQRAPIRASLGEGIFQRRARRSTAAALRPFNKLR